MVVEMLTFLMYTPFARSVLLFSAQPAELCVFFQFVSVKVHFTDGGVDDAVFVVTVTNLTCFSVLNRFSNVRSYGTDFRVGIRPRGPRTWPSWPTTRIASGDAITTSKFISPFLIWSARSSIPTSSAPAALAASAFGPRVNTATRTERPVPCGSTVAPRTFWSDLRASMPRLTATSTLSLNLAVASSFSRAIASLMSYCLVASTFHGSRAYAWSV